MHTNLIAHFTEKIRLTTAEQERLSGCFQLRHVRKKKSIVQEGEVCRILIFVNKGSFRSYTIDEKGVEHVLQLALENHWVSDLYSFITQKPGQVHIEALEDSEVLVLSYKELQDLYRELPVIESYFRQLYERAYVALQLRLNDTLSIPAEERYRELVANQPGIAQRVALIHIASYLGITPESLSRIRKHM